MCGAEKMGLGGRQRETAEGKVTGGSQVKREEKAGRAAVL